MDITGAAPAGAAAAVDKDDESNAAAAAGAGLLGDAGAGDDVKDS